MSIRFFTLLYYGLKNRIDKIYRFLLAKTITIKVYYVTPLALCSDRVKFACNTEAKRVGEECIKKKKRGEIRGDSRVDSNEQNTFLYYCLWALSTFSIYLLFLWLISGRT